MEELVSIVIPCYNSGKFIRETLDSILAQTYPHWEALIVDDCSTDDSVAIVEEYAKRDARFRLYRNEKNSGAAYTRNVALKAAQGKWVAFLDSDDVWFPEKLEKQIGFMNEKGYAFSYTDYCRMEEDSTERGEVIIGPKKISKAKMFCYNYLGCLTVMYDREKVGLIQVDESIRSRNDYAIWLKACKKATCYRLCETLAKYRLRKQSVSHGSFKKSLKNQYRLYRISEGMNGLRSVWHVSWNLFFGALKKFFYKKKVKE